MEIDNLKVIILGIIKEPSLLSEPQAQSAVREVIEHLDKGRLRVSSKVDGKWVHYDWVRQAILYYFRLQKGQL